ncbi:uncharacterized protein CTRU02_202901 [Colletotrichum truncatum]|uniref:Uncharacterized protein n=1 Tax=Colletotrichum truncatum TaxID=5467 RepID=A0ACC3ZLJ3_COLTU|nr:uncharacterized protein CTRU02_12996 [Colletotrichum truncatum]KAF6783980.1 hypothetical protein CTRU02_12996 [Colletotrichum truncatum]
MQAFRHTCLNMISTGIHKWGFVIYRCTYEDDELWNRYLAQLKSFYHADLLEKRRAELLEQYLSWDIIEDRATLENASRLEVRKHFNRWVTEQNVPTLPAKALQTCSPSSYPASNTVYTSTRIALIPSFSSRRQTTVQHYLQSSYRRWFSLSLIEPGHWMALMIVIFAMTRLSTKRMKAKRMKAKRTRKKKMKIKVAIPY